MKLKNKSKTIKKFRIGFKSSTSLRPKRSRTGHLRIKRERNRFQRENDAESKFRERRLRISGSTCPATRLAAVQNDAQQAHIWVHRMNQIKARMSFFSRNAFIAVSFTRQSASNEATNRPQWDNLVSTLFTFSGTE